MKNKNIKNYKNLSDIDKKVWDMAMSETKPLKKSDQTSNEYKLSNNSKIDKSNEIEKELNFKLNLDKNLDIKNQSLRKKFKNKKLIINAHIDLHGLTISDAYKKLLDFIYDSYHKNRKCVLVITGKSKRFDKDYDMYKKTIKELLPLWLADEQINKFILEHSLAKIYHGGDGARYIFLKNKVKV